MKTQFEPEYLKRWMLPASYAGAQWPEYYSFLGRSRDSDALERANFDAGLMAIGGEASDKDREDAQDPGCALSIVRIVRESHWAVGWVEWIAIHESATEILAIADEIEGKLSDYPVIDDDLFSQYEMEEANEIWRDCYDSKERVEYILKHESQFEFRSFSDLMSCARGKYFAGYASELLH